MFKILEKISEIIGWFQIVISPFLIACGIGCIVYYNFENRYGLISAISIAIIGLILGILLATRMYKTKGTVWFLSRVMASPELDNKAEPDGKQHDKLVK
jgi:hypothetical protein